MLVIGITGTLGAGKGTIVEYLVGKKDFAHFSVRQYLIKEMQRQGLKINRDNMVTTANGLRTKHSPSFIIEELYAKASTQNKNAVIESIRTPGEIDFLKKQGNFLLLAVDADPEIRYERIKLRKSVTDRIDFKTFLENEQREMNTTDPNKQNLRVCIDRADIKLLNNGTKEELFHQLEKRMNL